MVKDKIENFSKRKNLCHKKKILVSQNRIKYSKAGMCVCGNLKFDLTMQDGHAHI